MARLLLVVSRRRLLPDASRLNSNRPSVPEDGLNASLVHRASICDGHVFAKQWQVEEEGRARTKPECARASVIETVVFATCLHGSKGVEKHDQHQVHPCGSPLMAIAPMRNVGTYDTNPCGCHTYR